MVVAMEPWCVLWMEACESVESSRIRAPGGGDGGGGYVGWWREERRRVTDGA